MNSSADNNVEDLSRSKIQDSLPRSQPITSNNEKNFNSSLLPSSTNENLRTHRNTASISTSVNLEDPSFTLDSDDYLFVTPPPFNQESITPQTPPHPSSDYGDLIEYDEVLEHSSLLDPMPSNDLSQLVFDLTDSPPVTVSEETGKRLATSTTDERPTKNARVNSSGDASKTRIKMSEEIDMVDLRDVDTMAQWEEKKAKEAAEALKERNLMEANKPFKLSDFQCIICMDSPTDLTITHCGHLFCSECLHQALHMGDKKCCPVCRSAVYLPRPGSRQTKNGIFALEIKLMTKTKKDKRIKGRA